MLQLTEVAEILRNDKKLPKEWRDNINLRRGVFYRMSLHIDGACPSFYSLRYDVNTNTYVRGKNTLPNNYFGVEYQEIFDNYLFSRHPREAEVTRQWRMSQYKPFTQAPFSKIIDVVVGSVFQDSGYVVKIADQKDAEYIDGNNFKESPFVEYLSSKFGSICSDPNGYFIPIPKRRRDEWGIGQKIEFDIPYVLSKDIIYQTEDEIIFHYNGYAWNVNKIGYFRFQEVNRVWVDADAEIGGYYAHMLNRLPIVVGGGKWNEQGFYDSYLMAARAYADEYVSSFSAEQMVNKEASHPYIAEAQTECPQCHGRKTVEVVCHHESGSGEDCNICGGFGKYSDNCGRCNASGEISHNPSERLTVPMEDMEHDFVKIVNPDVTINKFHAENNDAIFNAMLEALHLNTVEQAQSGVAKTIDLETRHQLMSSIANQFFNRIAYQLIWYMLAMRNARGNGDNITPDTNPQITIIPPTQFQIKTSFDLAEEYKLATDSGLPAYVRSEINTAYIDKQFGGDMVLRKKAEMIKQMDFLNVLTPDEIATWILNGAADARDAKFHLRLPFILDEVIRDMSSDTFLNATYEAIKSAVDRKFNAMSPIIPTIRPNITEERLSI